MARKYKNRQNSRYLKYVRRSIALLFTAVITIGALSGCGRGEDGKEAGQGDSAKGRYVEEDMELPVQEGEEILNMAKAKEGNPVLYSQSEDGQVFRYEYRDSKWEKEALEWIYKLYGEQDIYLQEIAETKDGAQIVSGMDEEMAPHIARSTDGQTGEELEIPYLRQQSDYGYPAVTNLQIDGAGNYWINDMYQAKCAVIDPNSLETLQEFNTAMLLSSEQRTIFGASNGDTAVNTEDGLFTIYGQDLKEKGTLQADYQEQIGMCSDGEIWYILTEKGITRMAPGNETSEVIMDGSVGQMGSSMNMAAGFIRGQKDDFYALYRQAKSGTCSLVHYVYDAEAPAVPEHTLRVFGLSENTTVQDAIRGFQKSRPDVKVEFGTSGKEEGISMDDIRTLNTELLSGNGADVLLLDGLPADAYIEKGILADLTDLADGLLSQEPYLEPILKNAAQKDGKVYGMPVKFSVPIIYGNEEAKEAFASADKLKAYVDAHPNESVVGVAERSYIRDFLFQMYQDEVIKEDGRVDQEKLAALLETEVKIAANARPEVFDDAKVSQVGIGTTARLIQQGMFNNAGSQAIVNHPDSIATDTLYSVTSMMIPYTIMREMNLSPDTLKDFYIPRGIVGINKNSKQTELAKEFVQYLFSGEIQGKPLDDGLPVLESALAGLKDEVSCDYAQEISVTSGWNIDGEEPIQIKAGYPTAEEVEDLIGKCRTLGRPAIWDCIIWNIYQSEADACLEGSTDAKTAAKNIAQKVDTYLAE